jgi:predicted regulator of Ras-like GTPase activity (Roadblock/LC7/MglB family)
MPSIRDLVAAIGRREGVDAAVVLGRDGLLIDCQVAAGIDADDLSARVPGIVGTADELGTATGRGSVVTAVLEHDGGIAIISVLSAEALLLVLASPRANIGQLLYELRRNRDHIAALV